MRYNVPKSCANTVMLRLQGNPCASRTVSDPANRFERHGRKILCRTPVSKRSHVGNLRQIRKQGKVGVQRRKPQVSLPLCPRGAATFRHPQAAHPSLNVGETLRPSPSARFEPAGAEKRCRPSGVQQFSTPAFRCRKKAAVRQGRTRLRSSRAPLSRCRKRGAAQNGRTACAVRAPRKAGALQIKIPKGESPCHRLMTASSSSRASARKGEAARKNCISARS